jgi:hypothetical protein
MNLAQLVGLIALIWLLVSFLYFKTEAKLRIGLTTYSGLFSIHFLLLGAYAGALMSLLGAARGIFSIYAFRSNRATSLWWPFAFTLAALGLSLISWQGPISLLPAIALSFSTWALWQKNSLHIRLLCLSGVPFWMCYSFLVGSWPGFICDGISGISILISLHKFHKTEVLEFLRIKQVCCATKPAA